MKKIFAILLALLLCVPAFAEETAPAPMAENWAADDMAQLLGMTGWELMEFYKGYEKDISRFDDGTTVYVGQVQIRLTVEGDDEAEDFDWRNGIVWNVCVMFDPAFSLRGYRVGELYHDCVERALNDGWVLSLDESDQYRLMTNYDKTIDGVTYSLQFFTDDDIGGAPVNEMVRMSIVFDAAEE